MTDTVRYAFAPITKREKQEDGSIIVHGPAADPSVDRDRQNLDPGWLAEAFPAWYAESGNIREQHDPKRAVGRAVGYAPEGDSHNIAARVVDSEAVKKIDADVLQGFSVGIKNPIISFNNPAAPNGTVVGGQIIEVSLVDRPANPNARFALAKADSAGDLLVVEDAHVETRRLTPEQQAVLDHVEALKADVALVTGHGVAEQVAYASGADTSAEVQGSQIDTATGAIGAIARLISGEADSLAAGNLAETYDISCLLDAVQALKFFINSEQEEAAVSKTDTPTPAEPTPAAVVETPSPEQPEDLTKTDDVVSPVEAPDLLKTDAFSTALQEAVAAAVTAAVTPLVARLDKVESLPVPGGPVIARTADQLAMAMRSDADRLKAEAKALLAKADACDSNYLAQGYRDNAALLLAKAGA